MGLRGFSNVHDADFLELLPICQSPQEELQSQPRVELTLMIVDSKHNHGTGLRPIRLESYAFTSQNHHKERGLDS